MERPRATLQRRLTLLVGGVGLVLAGVITGLGFTVADFRDHVNRRDDLIPAATDAAALSGTILDLLADLDEPGGAGDDRATELRVARQRTSVLVGRLERELADHPLLAAEVETLRSELLGLQTAMASRALLTSLAEQADSLTAAIADTVAEVPDDAHDRWTAFQISVLLASGTALVLLVVGAVALRRWVVVPVKRLAADVAIVAEGDYDHELRADGAAELGQLAVSVSRMRDRFLAERHRAVSADEAVADEAPAVTALRTLLAAREADPPPGATVAGGLLPAEGVLAGDWYDVSTRDGELVVCVGDVCGHGVDAGVLAVRTKFALLDALDLGLTPTDALDHAARRFGRDDTFVTALVAVVDPRTGWCRYASAGHNPALVVRRDGTVDELPRTGPLIGLAAGDRPDVEARLEPGELFIAYTDGVVEARDEGGRQLLLAGLRDAVLEHATDEPDRIVDVVLAKVLAHCSGRCTDDATIVVVRRDAT